MAYCFMVWKGPPQLFTKPWVDVNGRCRNLRSHEPCSLFPFELSSPREPSLSNQRIEERLAWGKADKAGGDFHHLVHHSADVAAVLLALLDQPIWLARANAAAGRDLTVGERTCLGALSFLHDIGKVAPGFQAKAWPPGHGLILRGHLECGWLWANLDRPSALGGAVQHLAVWPGMTEWLAAIFAHHGRPVAKPQDGLAAAVFRDLPTYHWEAEERQFGQAMLKWFPAITSACPPPPEPVFVHFFCGLLTLADWVASDRHAFRFEAKFRSDYWHTARQRAAMRVAEIGLSTCHALRGPADWKLISDHPTPRPAQQAVGALSADERLILLEAETGAGKTEAALWRFATLIEAGAVDAMYFAVPTRSAARQLHRRINQSLGRMFDSPPEAVLAIPGQAFAGEATGTRLPDFDVRWDDGGAVSGRWAAEHSARYLAARVAVGTVDQVALGGLQVKFAHLRGTALSRALLVIDEVHASDPYMTEIHNTMVQGHLRIGGHVMLMSATLGAAARRKWRNEVSGDLATDKELAYPAVWTSTGLHPVAADPESAKDVQVSAHAGWSATDAAGMAVRAAGQGARVLVIRNTVMRAQETFAVCQAEAESLLLRVNGMSTLHHSRFAAEDRALLDTAVENAIGKDSPMGGRIVSWTQTLEQSLDLCADLLITDLCPMDVLLQRIGRLHRHRRPRPESVSVARVVVLCPPSGLDSMTLRAENGLGASASGPSLSGVYVDVPGLQATWDQIAAQPVWHIPAMNRALVEAATHPQALETVAVARRWQPYRQRVVGKAVAEMQVAGLVRLDRNLPLLDGNNKVKCFPDDEKIRTRLGEEGVILLLPEGTIGAFGAPVTRMALPAHWSRGLTGEEPVSVEIGPPLTVTVSDMVFTYDRYGLQRGGNDVA